MGLGTRDSSGKSPANHGLQFRPAERWIGKTAKTWKKFLTFLVSMILHRYVQPRRTLHHPPAGHPPPGRHRAGVRQHPPALGFCPRPGAWRDRHLEGDRPHPPAVVRLPDRKPLTRLARPAAEKKKKKTRRSQESGS